MVELNDREADELLLRLRETPSTRAAAETISVLANAGTSVTLTNLEKTAVFEVLGAWLERDGGEAMGRGATSLLAALVTDIAQP
jgi:hypothetical protein